jgi:hypothetical protein
LLHSRGGGFREVLHRSPERLGPEHIRQYQAYLFRERKLSAGTIEGRTAALRFLFVKTLRRSYLPDYPFGVGHASVRDSPALYQDRT